ncbi:MAG: hypothetical protein ACOY93_09090 [Bacillota bacterium]
MKTRFLGLAIVMVALAVLVNVLALSSASVDSDLTVNVVNTATALIAMSAATTPDPDVVVDTTSGILTVTFDDGLQPASSYTFSPVFKITNNSDGAVTVTVTSSGTPAGMTVTMTDTANAALTNYSLLAGGSVEVKMTVTSDDTVTLANHAVTINVAASKV